MKCKICGANYDERLDVCPFCQSENEVKAVSLIQADFQACEQEAEEIRKSLPHKLISKSGKWICFGIILVGVLCGGLILFSDKIFQKSEELKKATEEHHKSKMEQYLEAKDYEGLQDYIYEKSLYDNTYSKYMEVIDAYREYTHLLENLEWLEEMNVEDTWATEEDKKETLYYTLYSGFNSLYYANRGISDMIPKKNEEYLEAFYDMTVKELEVFGFTADDCEEAANMKEIRESVVKSYVDEAYQCYFGEADLQAADEKIETE